VTSVNRIQVRGILQKMPGNAFSDYQTAVWPTMLTSFPQWQMLLDLMNDYFKTHDRYEQLISGY